MKQGRNKLLIDMDKIFSSKIIVIATVIVVAFFGYAAGVKTGETRLDANTSRVLNEARKYFEPIPEFNSISGRVLEIKDGKLVLEAYGLPQNPFESIPTRRTVFLIDSTSAVKIINKSSDGYEKEVEEYQKRLKASAGQAIFDIKPPSLTEETPISLNEIMAGDTVLVEAGGPIKTKTEFGAVKIILQSRVLNFFETN